MTLICDSEGSWANVVAVVRIRSCVNARSMGLLMGGVSCRAFLRLDQDHNR